LAAGAGGFAIQGYDGHVGWSVSGAGDVNGDGIDEVVVGSFAEYNPLSAAYVVFGHTGRFASPVDLRSIAAGHGGFMIRGEGDYDAAGWSVSNAGDVNGDGIDDLIVGAPHYHLNGANDGVSGAYVVFGRTGGFTSPVDLRDIAAGHGGF